MISWVEEDPRYVMLVLRAHVLLILQFVVVVCLVPRDPGIEEGEEPPLQLAHLSLLDFPPLSRPWSTW
jgi:hypothetical protein